jgi:hypothetical protein
MYSRNSWILDRLSNSVNRRTCQQLSAKADNLCLSPKAVHHRPIDCGLLFTRSYGSYGCANLEPFTRRRIARRNLQRSVVNVQTVVSTASGRVPYRTSVRRVSQFTLFPQGNGAKRLSIESGRRHCRRSPIPPLPQVSGFLGGF